MPWLIFCIISSTTIFFVFKSISEKNIPPLPVILINYFVASAIGYISGTGSSGPGEFIEKDWAIPAIIIGILFILMFFVIGKSSREAGMSVTTIASKMSVVIPVCFSILIDPEDTLSIVKTAGIIIAVIAVLLSIHKGKTEKGRRTAVFFPVLLFIGMGLVDSLVKYAQQQYVGDHDLAYFSALLFSISFLTGLVIILFRKTDRNKIFSMPVIKWGLLLGAANFGSIYFLIRALNFKLVTESGLDSSVVFGINNSGIVLLSGLTGIFFFREKFSRINLAGLALSLVAIILFSMS